MVHLPIAQRKLNLFWGEPLTFLELWKAYKSCLRGKRYTRNAIVFEMEAEKNLLKLYNDLVSMRYQIGTSICFVVEHPKIREIFAGDFRDRIVHHLLCARLQKITQKKFIYDSSACQKRKGVLFASQRLRSHIQKSTYNGTKEAYYLQMDIQNFFGSIDKELLKEFLESYISHGWWRDLANQIVDHDPTLDYLYRGDFDTHKKVPQRKTLFFSPKGRGLPIGNLTSQFFGNIYLHELDEYIKRTLKCHYYQRYVDDFVLIHPQKEVLLEWRDSLKSFVKKHLHQKIHPRKIRLQKVSQGIDFIGYIHKNYRTYARRKTRGSLYHVYEKWKNLPFEQKESQEAQRHFLSSVHSYKGVMDHADEKQNWSKLRDDYWSETSPFFDYNFVRGVYKKRN